MVWSVGVLDWIELNGWTVCLGRDRERRDRFWGGGVSLIYFLVSFESPMDLSESYRSYEVTWFMDDALPGLGFQRGRGGAKRDPCD